MHMFTINAIYSAKYNFAVQNEEQYSLSFKYQGD